MEEDPFWLVQLTDNAENRMLAGEAPLVEYEDHALPAGTCTEQSLTGVLGRESEVSIPVGYSLRCHEGDCCSLDGSHDVDGSSGSGTVHVASWLILKLRQVNGDGVMSGVGGDVWCAALLLSAWLLQAPEVVRGLDVLELGSGLGLCGIVAGYVAQSVTLTDYVDELVINLQHNIEMNRLPRVDKRVEKTLGPPSTAARRRDDSAAVRGAETQTRGRRRQRPQQQQQQGGSGGGGEVPFLRRLSRSRVRACKLDWTDYEHEGTRNGRCQDDARGGADGVVKDWWWDDTGKPADDWREEGAATPPPEKAGSASAAAVLCCDVMIGSALVYSPHHACVADVLSLAFADGGCRAAHIVQLSTRPGFDDFLHRLRSCGLRYRLQRMSHVLPAVLLKEIRRNTPVTVVGGPVMRPLDGGGGASGGAEDGGGGGNARGGASAGTATAAAGFDEFVLCSVFRGGETTW